MKAMVAAKKQKARQQMRTLRKPNKPERPIIGSSSTWREEELETFKVQVGREVDVTEIIPNMWLEFGDLNHYESGEQILFFRQTHI
jgi:hypothetical protein